MRETRNMDSVKGLEVLAGAAGDHAAIDGLTRLVVRKVFAPESIDASLVDYALN